MMTDDDDDDNFVGIIDQLIGDFLLIHIQQKQFRLAVFVMHVSELSPDTRRSFCTDDDAGRPTCTGCRPTCTGCTQKTPLTSRL